MPEGASFLGSTQNLRTKDDTMDEIECYVVQSMIQEACMQPFGVIEPATL
jgi:hypothetical protein